MSQHQATPARPLTTPRKAVPLYFVGLHHLNTQVPIFYVKRRPYYAPTRQNPETGKMELVIGGTILVDEADKRELIEKTKAKIPGIGVVNTFTDDPGLADQIRRRYESGNTTPVAGEMSLAQAKVLLTPEQLAESVAEEMSEDDLEKLLAEKKRKKRIPPPMMKADEE